MHRNSSNKLTAFIAAPGIALALLTTVVYLRVESVQAGRRTTRTPSHLPVGPPPIPAAGENHPLNLVDPPSNLVEPRPNLVVDKSSEDGRGMGGLDFGESPDASQTPLTSKPLNRKEAEELLQSDLLAPWMSQAMPAHRVMSRAAPRIPVKPTFDLDSQPLAGTFLGVVTLQRYRERQTLPVAIDRRQGEIYVFANQRWQSAHNWLQRSRPDHPSLPRQPTP